MEDIQKITLFERKPIHKAVMILAIPTILSSLVMVIYNLADTWFVGLLNDPIQNSAVTLAAPVLLAFNAINNLFGVGTSSMMSRALGKKDYETVYRSSAFGFYCSVCCGLLFSILYTLFSSSLLTLLGADTETFTATANYLKWTVTFGAMPAILNVVMAYLVRSEGAALHASIGTMSGCLLNILLDPIFVLPWGLDMGAAGAGLATFISNLAACLYFFILLFVKRKTTYVCIRPSMFGLRRDIITGVCGVGIPASIQNLLNVTGMTVLNNFIAGYGSSSVAAMGIAQKINMVPMYIALGLSQGIMPLISYNYASRNYDRVKRTILFAGKISVSFLIAVSICFYLFSDLLNGFFIRDELIIKYGSAFLRGFCLALPFQCIDFLAVGAFQACGMGAKAFIFALLRKVILEIPALFMLNYFFPMYGLAYAQLAAEFVLAAAAILTLARMFHRLMNSVEKYPTKKRLNY